MANLVQYHQGKGWPAPSCQFSTLLCHFSGKPNRMAGALFGNAVGEAMLAM